MLYLYISKNLWTNFQQALYSCDIVTQDSVMEWCAPTEVGRETQTSTEVPLTIELD